ncbi:MAG: hypothetical protein ABH824_01335 [Nanoarchaeota archaeon]|nr:hypothetical protein [Nanoarchaeota archaeon]MBU1631934.1 hypothetical protein [Nanoarchaeota archaeon]MBU1876405.1 hypothetical protein [Nanoarchaeota archaeon]
MKIGKTIFLITLVITLLVTVSSALALNVTSTPESATEGKLYTYNIKADITNPSFTNLQAVSFTPDNNPQINVSTGIFTWVPGAGETGDRKFQVTITNLDNLSDTLNYQFDVPVEPVLDITSIKIGKTGGSLVSYEDGNTTSSFKPADNITIELTVKNKYTVSSYELISNLNQNVNPTIENVNLAASVNAGLTSFPTLMNYAPNPFYLDADQQQIVTFTYKIPESITTGTYSMQFNVDGDDLTLPHPGNLYSSQKTILLDVNQNAYDVSIKSASFNDNDLTCSEKKSSATLNVQVLNTGLGSENVKVVVTNSNLNINEESLIVVSASGTTSTNFNVDAKNLTGTEQFTISVYKKSTNQLYGTTTTSLTAENCPVQFSNIPTQNIVEDVQGQLDISTYYTNYEGNNQVVSFSTQDTQNLSVNFVGDIMYFTPAQNWYGQEIFTLNANDGYNQTKTSVTVQVSQNKVDDLPSISTTSPTDNPIVVKEDTELEELKIDISNPDQMPLTYYWFVNGNLVGSKSVSSSSESTSKLKLSPKVSDPKKMDVFINGIQSMFVSVDLPAGSNTVKVEVDYGTYPYLSKTWNIDVKDKPVDINQFPGPSTTDLSKITDMSSVANFVLENSYGKIEFTENVDLSDILYLAQVVSIEDGQVAVDSDNAAGLNKAAKITLYKTYSNPLIQKSTGYKTGTFTQCALSECTEVSKSNGLYVFTVTGFSTYKVIEKQPSEFEVSEVLFDEADRSKTVNTSITIKNTGTSDSLTNVAASFVDVDSKYNAKLVDTIPSTLAAGQEINVKIQVDVPEDEDSGKHSIGKLKLTSNEATKEVTVYLNPKSFIIIESIKINGKTSGDLSIEDINEIKVQVQNDYTEDLEDVTITVQILGIDGEDLEEETDGFDLDEGDDTEKTLEFDLSGENLNEDQYTIEITIEGKATDGSNHKVTETKIVNVERENHQIIVEKTSITSNTLQCSKQTTLYVTVKNIGKSNEDNVEIYVKNSALNLNLKKSNIDLEKHSSTDNDYKATFTIDVTDAAKGTYPLAIEVYRDGDELEDSEEINLEVKDCFVTSVVDDSQDQYAKDSLAAELQKKLAEYKVSKEQQDQSKVNGSFRESENYTTLLGILVMLIFIAVILGAVMLFVKKK